MEKRINFSKSVKDLCGEYPEVIDILKELGFDQVTSPGMLNTVGRFMTIPKGASMRDIDMETIKKKFIERGFDISE